MQTSHLRDAHLLSFALESPWALHPPMLAIIAGIIARHVAGQSATDTDLQAALVNRQNLPQPKSGGGVAIIPIRGVIAPRMNLLSDISGGTSFEQLGQQLDEAAGLKTVSTIVLDIDSPGGNVQGASEFARKIMAVRAKKPVIAQVEHMAASAGYWLAAAATKIVASPSSLIGAIGVYTAHTDISESLKQLGVKRTYFSAGKGKVDGLEGPLSDDGAARTQSLIDGAYARFAGDVVKGRGKGLTVDQVRNEWKAYVYSADEALASGMIDEIATRDQTLATLLPSSDAQTSARADTTQEPTQATVQDHARAADRQRLELALLDL
jgi:signal peptide peptidase SppA